MYVSEPNVCFVFHALISALQWFQLLPPRLCFSALVLSLMMCKTIYVSANVIVKSYKLQFQKDFNKIKHTSKTKKMFSENEDWEKFLM